MKKRPFGNKPDFAGPGMGQMGAPGMGMGMGGMDKKRKTYEGRPDFGDQQKMGGYRPMMKRPNFNK
jgi:hypothetical protein